MTKKQSAYAASGVDIDSMDTALRKARRSIENTRTPGVIGGVGSFGGLFKSPGTDHVLVSSMDGVGTKLEVADMAGRHNTVGQDLVNHCVNDILVQGASPLFFMDYLGTGKLQPSVFAEVVKGLSKACAANGCALLGGETAEMPGLYPGSSYDLVGTIVGSVPKKNLITGTKIRAGDCLVGLPSTGLHTNGYTLARHILFKQAKLEIDAPFPGMRRSVGQVLLDIHRSYLKPVQAVMKKVPVKGMAHITGGGLADNLPRVIPEGLSAIVDQGSWRVPKVFSTLQELGSVDEAEMFRVFNMGIGLVLVVRDKDLDMTLGTLLRTGEKPRVIGNVAPGQLKFERI